MVRRFFAGALERSCSNSRLKYVASIVSLAFAALLVSPAILWAGFTGLRIDYEHAIRAQEVGLERKAAEFRETICLANVVYHEARGERKSVRDLTARVVLAMAADHSFTKAKNVCALARIKGMFSNIHHVGETHANLRMWPEIYDQVTHVYYGDRRLPRGWGCVRGFRLSDKRLESLSWRELRQLGITRTAKGLKYHAAAFVPVDTRGDITFYSPRGGCRDLSPTT